MLKWNYFRAEQKFQSLAYLTFQPVSSDVESNRFGKLQTRLLLVFECLRSPREAVKKKKHDIL